MGIAWDPMGGWAGDGCLGLGNVFLYRKRRIPRKNTQCVITDDKGRRGKGYGGKGGGGMEWRGGDWGRNN